MEEGRGAVTPSKVRGQPEVHLPPSSASTPHPGHRRGTEGYVIRHRTQPVHNSPTNDGLCQLSSTEPAEPR